ncbi:hypothetical protein M404DRAFT_991184 [Pisolithus tinctorius Marx 270]|uniref:Uncharacterized protein n=1 Tax=Pisolithus tinctorius Marx 270 TaxID=870435 RepID=A0A0C3PYT8_PISTI|nr:hypothetical protein M404DRAFT_991184 [Pisolithus tinctorius Marx 270]
MATRWVIDDRPLRHIFFHAARRGEQILLDPFKLLPRMPGGETRTRAWKKMNE